MYRIRQSERIEDSSIKYIAKCPRRSSEEGKMKGDRLTSVFQTKCDHAIHGRYTQRRFDILNGFELISTRCINCHETLALEVKKLN